jgi:predicted nucleic-acid-binding protein
VLDAVFGLAPEKIARAVDMLLEHSQLTLQDPEVIAAALKQFRARPALGFSDCLVLEIARKAGQLPLGTFDRTLASVPGAQRLSASGSSRSAWSSLKQRSAAPALLDAQNLSRTQ